MLLQSRKATRKQAGVDSVLYTSFVSNWVTPPR